MAIENKYIFFPVTKTGYWHNGIHIYKKDSEDFVISPFVGKILKKSQSIVSIYPEKLPKIIYVREIILTAPPEVAEKYENLSSIDFTKLKKDEQEKVLEAIGLSSNPSYILQKHTISFKNEMFSYYSFIRHFSKLCDFKKIKNDEYIFPHDKVGEYGKSEGENNMVQLEYFITADSSYFNITAPDIFDYCDNINNEFDLYKKDEQPFEELYFNKKTEFSVLHDSKDDYKKYPGSLHIKVKSYHVNINENYKKENSLRIEVNDNVINVHDKENNIVNQIKIDIKNPLTNNIDTELVYTKYLKTKNNDIKELLYTLDPFNLQPFWTEADSEKLQYWDDYIFTKGDVMLKKYSMQPDKKIFSKLSGSNQELRLQFFKAQEDGVEVLESTENRKFIKIEEDGRNFYFLKDDIKYNSNYWKDFKDGTAVFLKKDLTPYNPNDDDFKNCSDLQKIMKKKNVISSVEPNMELGQFLEKNKSITLKCAFQHISEWSQVEINPFKIDHPEETSDLWEKMRIWSKDGKSSSFPREVSDSSKFIYFHPAYFENWLFNLHRCFAKKLISVQNLVMKDFRLVQGNCGIYYNFHDYATTFCNHAVFETIIKVDGNFNNFTKKTANKKNISRDPLKEDFPECPDTEKYKYKPSNYWCDVLEEQSENSEETGICKISAEQAFYMAQLGYVVIAAWKNLTPFADEEGVNYSPHFVTISPIQYTNNFINQNQIKVAHVGGGTNKFLPLKNAFDQPGNYKKKSCDEVLFYCNIKQCFI
ncbi:hypothetical protein [Treponema sp.]|uniref:hypothetical protein n=1 Tax=Treponema sp. TaxID=166 RepID=UPI00257D0E7B|nr:hypothetical protein [Treponema sp.]